MPEKSLILQGHCDVVPGRAAGDVGDAAVLARGEGRPDVWPRRLRHEVRTIGALYALDAIKDAGLKPTARDSLPVRDRGGEHRRRRALDPASAAIVPTPVSFPSRPRARWWRSQVGVIWFRLKVRGFPCMCSRPAPAPCHHRGVPSDPFAGKLEAE